METHKYRQFSVYGLGNDLLMCGNIRDYFCVESALYFLTYWSKVSDVTVIVFKQFVKAIFDIVNWSEENIKSGKGTIHKSHQQWGGEGGHDKSGTRLDNGGISQVPPNSVQ